MYDEIRTPLISDIKQRIQCYNSLNYFEKIKFKIHMKPLKLSKCFRDMYILQEILYTVADPGGPWRPGPPSPKVRAYILHCLAPNKLQPSIKSGVHPSRFKVGPPDQIKVGPP